MAKGGKRNGAGRPKGAANRATAEIKEAARKYGVKAIKELATLAGLIDGEGAADSEQARIAALREVLDRGYGKPAQVVAGDPDEPVNVNVDLKHANPRDEIARRIAGVAARIGAGKNTEQAER